MGVPNVTDDVLVLTVLVDVLGTEPVLDAVMSSEKEFESESDSVRLPNEEE